jgi:hypothetical protein
MPILPTPIGRWQPFHQFHGIIPIPKSLEAWGSGYLAWLKTIKELLHGDVIQTVTTLPTSPWKK